MMSESLIKKIIKIAGILFLIVWCVIPLIFSAKLFDSYIDAKTAVYIMAGLIFLSASIFFKALKMKAFIKTESIFLLFLIWAFIGLIPAFSKIECFKSAIYILAGLSAAIFIINLPDVKNVSRHLPILSSVILLIVSIYGFLQFLGFDFFKLTNSNMPVSTFGNLNFAAHYLVAVLPLLIFAKKEGTNGILSISAIALGLIFLAITQSRGGYLAFIASMLFAGYIVYKKYRGAKYSTNIKFLRNLKIKAGIIVAGAILIIGTLNILSGGEFLNHFLSTFDKNAKTNKYRLSTYDAAVKMTLLNPIAGVGAGNFRYNINYLKTQQLWELQDFFSITRQTQTHNDYLNIMCELGFPGLILFLLTIFFSLFKGLKKFKEANDENAGFYLAVLAGYFGILTHALFDFPLYNPPAAFCFWTFSGILLAPKSDDGELKLRQPTLAISSAIILFIILFVGIRINKNEILSSYFHKKSLLDFENSKFNTAAEYAGTALKYNIANTDIWGVLGDSLKNMKKYNEATVAYHNAINRDPSYIPYYERVAFCYANLGQIAKAKEAYQHAIEINPFSVPNIFNLAKICFFQKDYSEAANWIGRGMEISKTIDAPIKLMLAECLYQMKLFPQSYLYFKEALPESANKKEILKRLTEISKYLEVPQEEIDKNTLLLKINQ